MLPVHDGVAVPLEAALVNRKLGAEQLAPEL
jgi:hypothetical protein